MQRTKEAVILVGDNPILLAIQGKKVYSLMPAKLVRPLPAPGPCIMHVRLPFEFLAPVNITMLTSLAREVYLPKALEFILGGCDFRLKYSFKTTVKLSRGTQPSWVFSTS